MRRKKDKDYAVIAHQLGVSEQNVGQIERRAIRKLWRVRGMMRLKKRGENDKE